ncbi:MAG: hypothetical protein V1850_02055 [Candidatus Bathyarchaeota archaeon]
MQSGTTGNSTIYANKTSALVKVVTGFANSTSSKGHIAYRSNTGVNLLGSPKERIWNGTIWSSSETEMPDAGSNIRWIRTVYSPLSSRYYENIVVTLSADGYLDAYIWSGYSWSVTNNIGYVGTTANNYRAFDIVYEKTSGRGILVYGVSSTNVTRDLAYKIWDGTQWSSEYYINDDGHSTNIQIWWVALAAKPKSGSNEIGLLYIDNTDSNADAFIWDGSNWGNRHELTGTVSINGEESIALAYEQTSANLMIVAGEGSLIRWNRWTVSGWGTSATFDINTGSALAMNWLSLKADPASNRSLLVSVDGASALCTAHWDGTTWTVDATHDTAVNSNAARCADSDWEPTGTKALLVWGTASGSVSYKTWSVAGGWSGASTVSNAGTHPWIQLIRNPRAVTGDVKIIGATLNSNQDIFGFKWDGTTLTFQATAFTIITTSTAYECYHIAFRHFEMLAYSKTLKIVNTITTNWIANLTLYQSSNIGRLSIATLNFQNVSTSSQIAIRAGTLTKSAGPQYNLAGSATIYISIDDLYSTASGTSYLYIYLRILYPSTRTYSLYIITFEIS